MRRIVGKICAVFITAIFILLSTAGSVRAQTDVRRYFPDTGHWLVGNFYDFYMDYERAETVYGSPITDQYLDNLTGRTIQYFQNARFEIRPENPPGLQVVVTPLGEILYEPAVPIQFSTYTPNCRQALSWDFPVCYSFFDFYLINGGQARLGAPISGLEFTRGHLVQHFEYARMVWNPGHPEGAKVTLAPLGQEYFSIIGEDLTLLEPVRNHIYNISISELHIKAFTRHAMVSPGHNQTVYVMVRDQNDAPVIGGRVSMKVEFPDGSSETLSTVATNDIGLAELNFPVESNGLGLAKVTIGVVYGNLLESSVTSFRIWY